MRRDRVAVLARFLLVNALNTGLYWGLYLLLLLVLPYLAANALALVVSIGVAYVANARFAFGVETSAGSLLRYCLANGTTVVLRTGVVWLLVDVLSLPEPYAPPLAVAITTPAAFVLTAWALRVPSGRQPAEPATVPRGGVAVAAAATR